AAGAGEVAAEAAARGQEVVVAVTRDEVGRVTDTLRDGETEYVVEGG
ncbi:Crp/Fnr family transcriptional regulator, partial [Halolamina salina]